MIRNKLKVLRLFVLRKLNAIPKEQRDSDDAKLGSIIERHIDDEAWLLEKIGISDHYRHRIGACFIDRLKIIESIEKSNIH